MKQQELPARVTPKLKSAPKIRELYWCDFPKDAQLPEFWKRRPVIILSYKNTLYGTAVIVPCTTEAKQNPKHAFPLNTTIDNRPSWAICDKITTVAVSRLVQAQGKIIRMPENEFNDMLKVVLNLLPKLPSTLQEGGNN